jgi:SAM-dependent methyltransferase
MKQNKYDDPGFFEEYSRLPRSTDGLSGGGEWYAFRSLLPDVRNKRVLDLGCGFGWHCRYVREQGAGSVVGVDLSDNMLDRARKSTPDAAIEYRRQAIEDIDFSPGEFDVVISSLALHYVERFDIVCEKVQRCLKPGGDFIFSVEHPVFTARAAQDWYYDEQGKALHWPLDNYQQEGLRKTRFLGNDDVIKYHRTIATQVNTLIGAGFRITRLLEPPPAQEILNKHPEYKDELRRPLFLLIAAVS